VEHHKLLKWCIRFQRKTYEQTFAELSIFRNTVKEHLSKAAESIRNYVLSHPGDPMLVASLALFLEKIL
jgi:hypothetical protein